MSEQQIAFLKVADLRPNEIALRGVDETSEKFVGLLESVRARGYRNSIEVRPHINPETGVQEGYAIIDGLQRYTIAKILGKEEIPAIITNASDDDVLIDQIAANVHKIETKPVEYTKQILRILASRPEMNLTDIATLLSKSGTWIQERLNLMKLTPEIQKLVDDGQINVTNAYALAKLPPDEQPHWVEKAKFQSPTEFTSAAISRRNQLQKDARAGRSTDTSFSPTVYLQKLGDIKSEVANFTNLSKLLVGVSDTAENKVHAAELGARMALQWVLHSDPGSVDEQKKKHDAEMAERQRKRDAAASDRKTRSKSAADRTAYELSLFRNGTPPEQIPDLMKKYDEEAAAKAAAEATTTEPKPE